MYQRPQTIDNEPQDNEPETQSTAPPNHQQTVDDLQQQLNTLQQGQVDLLKLLQTVISPTSQPAQASQALGSDPQAQLMQMIEQTMLEFRNHDALTQQYSQKYPDLVPFKDAILHMANQHATEATMRGNPVSDEAALEAAIARMQENLSGYVKNQQKKQQGDTLKRQALSFNVGQGTTPNTASLTDQLNSIGNDDAAFAKLKASYLKSRGIAS